MRKVRQQQLLNLLSFLGLLSALQTLDTVKGADFKHV